MPKCNCPFHVPHYCPARYYLLQSCISGLCTLVLNVLLLLQVGNLLGQFENLEPKWPYLPMVIFQLACVAVVDFMQVGSAACRVPRAARHGVLYLVLPGGQAAGGAHVR